MNHIADIRKDYKLQSLSENDIVASPFEQFKKWWDEAIASEIDEVNAMTLATVSADGKPSARIVLLKGLNENGFQFYTNYESHKAKEMDSNKNVALIFFWKELERQIRIEGTVTKLSDTESDSYFNSRPTDSKIGAWSSPQSKIIPDRDFLENQVLNTRNNFEGEEITRPPFWGGYAVTPSLIEFWQGRSNRLHDRLQYSKKENSWIIERLAP